MQKSIEDDFQNEGFRAWNYIRGRGKEGFKQRRECIENAPGEKVGAPDVKGGFWLPNGQAITLPSAFILPFKEYLARDNRIRPLSIREIMFTSRRCTENIED